MPPQQTRRDFLSASAALGAAALFVNPGTVKAARSANEKLNIAAVGTFNRALADIKGCSHENIVALCDIDSTFLDATGEDFCACGRPVQRPGPGKPDRMTTRAAGSTEHAAIGLRSNPVRE